jgi:hypothetical protein
MSPPSGSAQDPDPFFNPPFFNDVLFKDRGWFKNIAHFAQKHKSENLVDAATNHIMSHLEFGGCLADYPGLNSRYNRLRHLEDVDELTETYARNEARVRFVNYFTLSTGRLHRPKSKPTSPLLKPTQSSTAASASEHESLDGESHGSTPRISIEDHSDSGRAEILQSIEPMPEEEDEVSEAVTAEAAPSTGEKALPGGTSLPAIPPLPDAPVAPDLSQYTDKDARQLAQKEAKRAQKAYDQAVKDREKAIKERQRVIEKIRRKNIRAAEKREKEAQKREKAEQKQRERASQQMLDEAGVQAGEEKQTKKHKERKFCMLPRKTAGERDSAWVEVYMEGVDEVGAHCGLFVPGPHYERLVGDVGACIVAWVHDDATRRTVLELREP